MAKPGTVNVNVKVNQTYWVVEVISDCPSIYKYLTMKETGYGWTCNIGLAIRFVREYDANLILGYSPEWKNAKAAEHMDSDYKKEDAELLEKITEKARNLKDKDVLKDGNCNCPTDDEKNKILEAALDKPDDPRCKKIAEELGKQVLNATPLNAKINAGIEEHDDEVAQHDCDSCNLPFTNVDEVCKDCKVNIEKISINAVDNIKCAACNEEYLVTGEEIKQINEIIETEAGVLKNGWGYIKGESGWGYWYCYKHLPEIKKSMQELNEEFYSMDEEEDVPVEKSLMAVPADKNAVLKKEEVATAFGAQQGTPTILIAINGMLLKEWNPIGGDVPYDEYLSYAKTVLAILDDPESNESDIASYLIGVELYLLMHVRASFNFREITRVSEILIHVYEEREDI